MRDGYEVVVMKDGEPILTIGRSILSGKADLTKDEADAIRVCGDHLVAFAGPEHASCFACGGVDQCRSDCAINPSET